MHVHPWQGHLSLLMQSSSLYGVKSSSHSVTLGFPLKALTTHPTHPTHPAQANLGWLSDPIYWPRICQSPAPSGLGSESVCSFAHIKARQIKTHKKCKIVLMSTVNPKLTRKFWVWTNFLEGQQLLCTWQGHPARPSSETARSQGSWWCFRDEDNAQFWPL